MRGFCDSEGHVERAISVRLCLKTHEGNVSSDVCPVVEDEMDEEDMDDTEEQSEEGQSSESGTERDDVTDVG